MQEVKKDYGYKKLKACVECFGIIIRKHKLKQNIEQFI